MNIKLKVPYIKQRKMTCGPSCLQQVFAYYGRNISLDDILKKSKMQPTGISSGHLGMCARDFGFETEIISYNVNVVDPTWMKLSKKKLLQKLKKRAKKELKFFRLQHEALAKYISSGGKVRFEIPSKRLILSCLRKGTPPILRLCSTLLYQNARINWKTCKFDSDKGHPFGHYLVVSGYENGNFIVADPSAVHGGIYKVPEDKLLFSWFFWGGEMLAVEPKK